MSTPVGNRFPIVLNINRAAARMKDSNPNRLSDKYCETESISNGNEEVG